MPMFYPFDTDFDGNLPADLYNALVLGVRDYARKTGFTKALLGLSGGIDSALTLRIAADAFGAENVMAIGMPSPFSSPGSVSDSVPLCENLGVPFRVIPIGDIYHSFGASVGGLIGWHDAEAFGNDVTEENAQARIRGAILMAISNRTGALVLSTGNKSEIAVGYCTLYGDMVGGLGVIGDLPKTVVYLLSRYANEKDGRDTIPVAIITKAPSAELRPGQVDQDSLPPYEVLDAILRFYVEEEMDFEAIVAQGIDRADAELVIGKIVRAEYKRKQAAPVLKVTSKAFGFGRQMPIATKPRTTAPASA
jgi:NAD+ synthase (glutamine-hydrolysing)